MICKSDKLFTSSSIELVKNTENSKVNKMSRIQINDLQCSDEEMRDLLPQELLIQGGGWFKRLTGWSTPSFFKKLDDVVHDLGGWGKVIEVISDNYYGNDPSPGA